MAEATQSGTRRWHRGVEIASDLGEYAKLIALLLAIAGLLGAYFPDVRRFWEQIVTPTGWYWVGTVRRDGWFRPNAYEHPLWNNPRRPVGAGALNAVVGDIMITGTGANATDEIHVGRARPGAAGAVRFVHSSRICLQITGVDMTRGNPKTGETFVWAQARKVSC